MKCLARLAVTSKAWSVAVATGKEPIVKPTNYRAARASELNVDCCAVFFVVDGLDELLLRRKERV